MPMSVEVAAPSRLHFGMFSFGQPAMPQFGGVGVMVARPGLRLRIDPAERFAACGPLARRAEAVVERLARRWQLPELPACRLEIVTAPPEHVGLGTGTQLALAVAAGLNAFRARPPQNAQELAAATGRGTRSAIGTYGFLHGGLLVEGGKTNEELLAPLDARVELPDDWRFVLVSRRGERGLAGEAEQQAFCELPPVPVAVTRELHREVENAMLPAARAGAFEAFSRSLYRFGYLAGTCFANRQGGPFAGAAVARLVATVRELGVEGVGQSSWGPTVFAIVEDEGAATRLADTLRTRLELDDMLIVTETNRQGARVRCQEPP